MSRFSRSCFVYTNDLICHVLVSNVSQICFNYFILAKLKSWLSSHQQFKQDKLFFFQLLSLNSQIKVQLNDFDKWALHSWEQKISAFYWALKIAKHPIWMEEFANKLRRVYSSENYLTRNKKQLFEWVERMMR